MQKFWKLVLGDNAINVVPKYCMIRLKLNNPQDIDKYTNRDGVHIEKISKDTIKLVAYGVAAHAAHPKLGDNAIIKLLTYLNDDWYKFVKREWIF